MTPPAWSDLQPGMRFRKPPSDRIDTLARHFRDRDMWSCDWEPDEPFLTRDVYERAVVGGLEMVLL